MPETSDLWKTRAEELADINQAIYKVLMGGQSYSQGSRSLTRASLSELMQRRNELEAEIAADTDGRFLSRTYAAEFDGR